jgi:hypothetical protein
MIRQWNTATRFAATSVRLAISPAFKCGTFVCELVAIINSMEFTNCRFSSTFILAQRFRTSCSTMQKCCSCSGSSASCSICAQRNLVTTTQQYSGGGGAAVVSQALQYLTGLDGSSMGLTPTQLGNRETRLRGNVRTLLHQTGVDGARGIITSGRMNRGSTGIAAGGIYFAVTANDTMHKAHRHGFLFTLSVRLGNVEHWQKDRQDQSVTFESLQRRGVDSVHIPRDGGDEYIVYHSDQVQLLSVQKVQLPANYPHFSSAAGFFPRGTICTLVGPVYSTSELQRNSAALDAFLRRV